jgi:hypothetical protein
MAGTKPKQGREMSYAHRLTIAAALALGLSAPAGAAELKEVWRLGGFDLPESVSWDAGRQVFYVSNLGTNPTAKDGNGFISKIKADGKMDVLRWVGGLNAPKGTEVVGSKLYVSDIDRLVEIDIPQSKVVNAYLADGAKFLNDVAVASDGRVFVADTFTNRIYVLDGAKLKVWVADPALNGPNGLTIVGNDLVVASLGDVSKGFSNMKPATIKKVDLTTKAISDFGTATGFGNLDGIEPDGKGGVTVTDNPGGRLLGMAPGGEPIEIGKLVPGAADHEFVAEQNLYVIPQMQQNQIVGYKYE